MKGDQKSEKTLFTMLLQLALGVGAIASFACGATAAEYPKKPITLVSPYGAGGNADLAARSLAAVAQKYLGQPLLVVNKTGAGGITGSSFVIDAKKDGYTLLLARIGSQAVAPAMNPNTPYKWDDFTFLGVIETNPYTCVVRTSSPIKSFNDFTRAIKERPGALSYAATSVADGSVVFPVTIAKNLKLGGDSMVKIPYQGGGAQVAAVLGGQVDFACNGVSPFISGIKGGQLRALVVSTKTRIPEAPKAPTAAEVGMPNLEGLNGWSALYGPPGLPQQIVDKWADVLQKVKDDKEWVDLVTKRGSVPEIMSPKDTKEFVKAQFTTFRTLAQELGIFK